MRFEYGHYFIDALMGAAKETGPIPTFDELGSDGWELVTIFKGIAYFKRAIFEGLARVAAIQSSSPLPVVSLNISL